ncbi:hypothetical protein L3X38_010146 [Prunus dulcis]|uniref:Uncharacterized protein n=1 Tax=Prunus dulcis TaxID=3755 RepID=A0AAD4WHE6_PRUDU|nr:hypothetical protein L3X38_010146 [Prunus dulcis]
MPEIKGCRCDSGNNGSIFGVQVVETTTHTTLANPLLHAVWPVGNSTGAQVMGVLHETFWELTGFGVIETPKLSELGARAIPGWVTHWEVARELPETKPCGQRGGPKRTISCYGGVDPGM